MPAVHMRMPTAVATVPDGGDYVAWTNADGSALTASSVTNSNGQLAAQSGAYAKAAIPAGKKAGIYVYFDGAFAAGPDPLPEDAEPVALLPEIYLNELGTGSASGAVYSVVQMLLDGEPVGDNRSDARTVKRSATTNPSASIQRLYDDFCNYDATTGRLDDDWGLGEALTAANILADGFGVYIEISNPTNDTINVGLDTVIMRVYDGQAAKVVAEPNATTLEVYQQINIATFNSRPGPDAGLHNCTMWYELEFPSGARFVVKDRGLPASRAGKTWNLNHQATDGLHVHGWGFGYQPTQPGTYKVRPVMGVPGTGEVQGEWIEFTVGASTAVPYYVDADAGDDGNDGLTVAAPKATIGGVLAVDDDDVIVYLKGGQTHTWAGTTVGASNVHILPWPGTGRPTIDITSQVAFVGCDQVSISECDINAAFDSYSTLALLGTSNLTVRDVRVTECNNGAFLNIDTTSSNILVHNAECDAYVKYFIASAASRYVEYGCFSKPAVGAWGGDGARRFFGADGAEIGGCGVTLFLSGCDNEGSGNSGLRVMAARYVYYYGCSWRHVDSSFGRTNSGTPNMRLGHTCRVESCSMDHTSRVGTGQRFELPHTEVARCVLDARFISGGTPDQTGNEVVRAYDSVMRHCTFINLNGAADGLVRVIGSHAKNLDIINCLYAANLDHPVRRWYVENRGAAGPQIIRRHDGNVFSVRASFTIAGIVYSDTDINTWNDRDWVGTDILGTTVTGDDLGPDFEPPSGHESIGAVALDPADMARRDVALARIDTGAPLHNAGARGQESAAHWPEILSATLNAGADKLTVTFDRGVDILDGFAGTLTAGGQTYTLSNPTPGDTDDIVVCDVTPAGQIMAGVAVTLDLDAESVQARDTGNWNEEVDGLAVENNSTVPAMGGGAPPPVFWGRVTVIRTLNNKRRKRSIT